MNLSEDRRESRDALSPRLFPVLVLLKVWSECGEYPCENVELILLLLESVCALEGVQDKDVTLQSLMEKLGSMEDKSLATKFTNSVEETVRSLNSFIDLFEKVLDQLLSYSAEDDENSKPPLISMSPHPPILGVFVSRCVSAYQCLTFCQVVRLHKLWAQCATQSQTFSIVPSKKVTEDKVKECMEEQDYMSALSELTLPSSGDHLVPDEREKTERDPSSDALRVAALHDYFGHKEEGKAAINEAIRLALHENNTKLLQHCLAWLHRLQPFAGEEALSVLKRLTTKAQELHQPLLAGWGKLEESKAMLAVGRDPQQVIQVAMSAGSGECVPVYGSRSEKIAHRGATLATLAKIWDHYGFSHVSQLYCQLQGHVMSCDPLPTELEGRESCAITVSLIARHLLNMGEYGAVKALFKSAKKLLKSNGKAFKLLCQCAEEVGFDWSVQSGDVGVARRHLTRLQSLHPQSALLRSAILSAALENYTETRRLAIQLQTTSSPQTRQRALELLAEAECVCGRPALALPHLMNSMTLSQEQHLSPYTTQLWLAQTQLQLECPYACASLATKCLLHFQACGDMLHRGISQFLLAQATLLTAHQVKGNLETQDVLQVIPVLEGVVADFQKTHATVHLRKAALLLAVVYKTAGYDDKREQMMKLALQTTTTSTHSQSHTT